MPGRPVLAEVNRKLQAKPEGESWVYDQLANGVTVGRVAEQLGISRRYLYYWRDEHGHKERRKPLWAEAMRLAAEAHAETGLEDMDELDMRTVTSAQVQLTGAKARHRQWLAGKLDPERFGEKGLELSFNVGELHLRALQRPRSEVAGIADGAETLEADVVAVEDGDFIEAKVEGEAQASERQLSPPSPIQEDEDEDELADLFV